MHIQQCLDVNTIILTHGRTLSLPYIMPSLCFVCKREAPSNQRKRLCETHLEVLQSIADKCKVNLATPAGYLCTTKVDKVQKLGKELEAMEVDMADDLCTSALSTEPPTCSSHIVEGEDWSVLINTNQWE